MSGDTAAMRRRIISVGELLDRLNECHQALITLAKNPPIANSEILAQLKDDVLLDLGSARQVFERDVRPLLDQNEKEFLPAQNKMLATAFDKITKHLNRIKSDATQVRDALDGRINAIEGSYGDNPKGRPLSGSDPNIGQNIADTIKESIEAGPAIPPRQTNSTEEPKLSAERQCRDTVTNILALAMDGAPICASLAAGFDPDPPVTYIKR